jgi:hypothetical protein
MSDLAREYARAIIAPVIVAVVVGLSTGYLGSRVALAVHEERIATQAAKIEKLEVQVEDLRALQISMTRIEVQMAQVMLGLERLNARLETTHR